MNQENTKQEKGFAPIIIIFIALVVLGIVGGMYYFSKSNASPLSSTDTCSSNKDAILGVVSKFENLQDKMDANGVLQLFTPPQTPAEVDTYTNLSGKDDGNLPRLYGTVSLNIKVLSFKVIEQPSKINNNSCSVVVEESRQYYGGPSNPQYLPAKSEDFKLNLTQKDNSWMIDQYQSQDPKVNPGKYSGWLMEFANTDQTNNWKTYTSPEYVIVHNSDQASATPTYEHRQFSIQYPSDWQITTPKNKSDLLTLQKENNKIVFLNSSTQVGNACDWDEKETISKYIVSPFTKLLRIKAMKSQTPANTSRFFICSGEQDANLYFSTTSLGIIYFDLPKQYKAVDLNQMDTIIATLKRLK